MKYKRLRWWRLVYVFDYSEATGYLCRVPVFVARRICKRFPCRCFDYAQRLEDVL